MKAFPRTNALSRCYCLPSTVLSKLTILTLLWLSVQSHASTSSTAPTAYESVRSLDQYGNAVQLENARAAAEQHGRLVIGIRRDTLAVNASEHDDDASNNNGECCYWILSTSAAPSQSLISPHRRPRTPSQDGIVHALWSQPPSYHQDDNTKSSNKISAMACTGVTADAAWLVRHVQTHAKQYWERYDDCSQVAVSVVTDALRLFWGNAGNGGSGQWNTATGGVVDKDKDQWARPLGVCTLLLQGSNWYLVEPSGVVQPCGQVCCMGPNGSQVQKKLEERLKKMKQNLDDEALEREILQVLTSTLGSKPQSVLLEVISGSGIERRWITS